MAEPAPQLTEFSCRRESFNGLVPKAQSNRGALREVPDSRGRKRWSAPPGENAHRRRTAVRSEREKVHPENSKAIALARAHHAALCGILVKEQGGNSAPGRAFSSPPAPGRSGTPQSSQTLTEAEASDFLRIVTTPLAVHDQTPSHGTDDIAIVASAQVSATEALPVTRVMSPNGSRAPSPRSNADITGLEEGPGALHQM